MLWLLFKHGGILLKTQEEKRNGKHENFFERLARERNISVEEMKDIISARIEQGLHDFDPEKCKLWEAIPCVGDVPTQEELLKYAVEKIKEIECEDLLKW